MLSNLWSKEPVAIVNAVRLICLAAMTFGLHLTPEQLVASMAALEALLTLFTRTQVTPTSGATAPPFVDMGKRLSLWLLPFLLAGTFAMSACASTDRFNRLAADLTHQAIVATENNRCTVHVKPCLSDGQFQAVNLELNKISVAGREFTKLRIAGTSSAADVHAFLATVASEVAILSKTYTDGAIAGALAKLAELERRVAKLIGGA